MATDFEVVYKAFADLTPLMLQARRAKKEVQDLKRATDDHADSADADSAASKRQEAALKSTAKVVAQAKKDYAALNKAQRDGKITAESRARAEEQLERALIRQHKATADLESATLRARAASRSATATDSDRATAALRQVAALRAVTRANDDLEVSHRRVIQVTSEAGGSGGSFISTLRAMRDNFGGARRAGMEFAQVLSVLKFPAIAAGIDLVVSALGAMAGAVVALIPSVGRLAAAFAALPGLIAGLLTAIGAAVLGFQGIGDALKALTAAEEEATTKSEELADRQEDLAYAVEQARRSLRNATEAVADAEEALADSHETLSDAEEGLLDAERDLVEAHEDLHEARQEAVRDLIDLRFAAEGAALSEKQAQLNLVEARRALQEMILEGVGGTDDLALQQARLNVEQAELSLREAKERSKRSQQDLNDAEKDGIEGSDRVVNAKERLRDAEEALADAHERVADSLQGIVKAERNLRDATEAVADAQRSLTEAIEEQTRAVNEGTAAQQKARDAMAKLSPPARAFVNLLRSMKPLLEGLKAAAAAGLFPGLGQALRLLASLFGVFRQAIFDTAQALAYFAVQVATVLASRAADMQFMFAQNVEIMRAMADATAGVTSALIDLTVAAAPLFEFLAQMLRVFGDYIARVTASARATGRLQRFFERVVETMRQWGRIFRNIGRGLLGVFKAAQPLTDWLIDRFEVLTQRFAEFANSTRGQTQMMRWFTGLIPILHELGRLVGEIFRLIIRRSEAGREATARTLRAITDKLLPAFEMFLNAVSRDFGPALVDMLTQVLRVLSLLSGATGGATIFVQVLGAFAKVLDILFNRLGPVSFILRQVAGVFFVLASAVKAVRFVSIISGFSSLTKTLVDFAARALAARTGLTAIEATSAAHTLPIIERLRLAFVGLVDWLKTGARKLVEFGRKLIALDWGKAIAGAKEWVVKIGTSAIDAIKAFLVKIGLMSAAQTTQGATAVTAAATVAGAEATKTGAIVAGSAVQTTALATSGAAAIAAGESFVIAGTAARAGWLSILGPIALVVAAIAIVVGLAIVIIKNWEKIAAFFDRLWEDVKRAFFAVWNPISDFFEGLWNVIKAPFEKLWDFLKGLGGLVGDFFDFLTSIPGKIVDAFKGLGQAIWNGIKEGVHWAIQGIVNFLNWCIDKINWLIDKISIVGLIPGVDVEPIPHIPDVPEFQTGGRVGAFNQIAAKPGSTDTVLAKLTPGEYVTPRDVVARLGESFFKLLERIVRSGGAAKLQAAIAALSQGRAIPGMASGGAVGITTAGGPGLSQEFEAQGEASGSAFVQGVEKGIAQGDASDATRSFTDTIDAQLAEDQNALADNGLGLMTGLLGGIRRGGERVLRYFRNLKGRLEEPLEGIGQWLRDEGGRLMGGFVSAARRRTAPFIKFLRETLKARIEKALESLHDTFRDQGFEAVKAMLEGANEAAGESGVAEGAEGGTGGTTPGGGGGAAPGAAPGGGGAAPGGGAPSPSGVVQEFGPLDNPKAPPKGFYARLMAGWLNEGDFDWLYDRINRARSAVILGVTEGQLSSSQSTFPMAVLEQALTRTNAGVITKGELQSLVSNLEISAARFIPDFLEFIKPVYPFNTGGQVPGGYGTSDTVNARLTPGEFVSTAGTVRRLGVGFFEAAEALAGGGSSKVRTAPVRVAPYLFGMRAGGVVPRIGRVGRLGLDGLIDDGVGAVGGAQGQLVPAHLSLELDGRTIHRTVDIHNRRQRITLGGRSRTRSGG